MSDFRFASSTAAALVGELGIDPATIDGTGRGGKITAADVRAAGAADAPEVPEGLGEHGQALWGEILAEVHEAEGDWELDRRELHFLERACRVEDELRALEAVIDRDGSTVTGSRGQLVVHPALSEARQLRLVQLRLLSALEIADPAVASTPARQQKRRAADARWGRRDHIQKRRRAVRERASSDG